MSLYYEVRNPDGTIRLQTLRLDEAQSFSDRVFSEEKIKVIITEFDYEPMDHRPCSN
jgi:hypothetical protein